MPDLCVCGHDRDAHGPGGSKDCMCGQCMTYRPEPACTCYWTDPSTWTMYGGAAEPGSQMEWNPDCPVHLPWVAP